jgi:hypothetical protein
MNEEFVKVFISESKAYSIKLGRNGPNEIVEEWARIVQNAAKGGYSYSLFELDNDFQVRTQIERLLTNEKLKNYPEFTIFLQRINEIDEKLRSAFMEEFDRPGSSEWWDAGVLKEAGPLYAENVASFYGLKVHVPDEGGGKRRG